MAAILNNNAPRNNNRNEAWKASGFLNFSLPNAGGKLSKLGAIPLHDDKVNEKTLRAWLEEDPSRVAKILSKLHIEYRSATPSETSAFALD